MLGQRSSAYSTGPILGGIKLDANTWLGGGFKYFLFAPLFGEDSHFDEHIFQRGWFNHQLDGTFVSCHFALKMRKKCLGEFSTLRPALPVGFREFRGVVFSEAFHGSMKSRNTFATRRPWQMVKRMSMRREFVSKTIEPTI